MKLKINRKGKKIIDNVLVTLFLKRSNFRKNSGSWRRKQENLHWMQLMYFLERHLIFSTFFFFLSYMLEWKNIQIISSSINTFFSMGRKKKLILLKHYSNLLKDYKSNQEITEMKKAIASGLGFVGGFCLVLLVWVWVSFFSFRRTLEQSRGNHPTPPSQKKS